jgi:adenosine deaminase
MNKNVRRSNNAHWNLFKKNQDSKKGRYHLNVQNVQEKQNRILSPKERASIYKQS